ncbi:hypothetical protein J6590_012450 [Homalodisca vitripennis]|nr:hypothetical protein J6590_012450 [Homalodisca vitripennis]
MLSFLDSMEEERQGLTNADATDNTIAESITATDNEDVVPISHTTSGGESDGGLDEDLEAGQTFELDETALPPPTTGEKVFTRSGHED